MYTEDMKSLDSILEALYDVISGGKGEKRNWDRFRHLYTAFAKLIRSTKNETGVVECQVHTPEDYIQNTANYLEENGFYEKEIHRVVERYGSLVHVFSTYESYQSLSDEKPFMRGINSIQLLDDGERWWVVQVYWLHETEELPLPVKYLPR